MMHNNPVAKEKLPKLPEGWEWIDKNEYSVFADWGAPMYGKWIAVILVYIR